MKLSYAIILIALLTGQSASLAFASTSVNGICQFDKSTMIKEKLKKAQECINNGNYSGAKSIHQEIIVQVRTLTMIHKLVLFIKVLPI